MKTNNSATSLDLTFEKIKSAAHIDSAQIMPHLIQLLGYRQRVAQDLIRLQGTANEYELKNTYDYMNEQIETILNL